eukprot:247459-Prorocentrum_minimum.AAC.1
MDAHVALSTSDGQDHATVLKGAREGVVEQVVEGVDESVPCRPARQSCSDRSGAPRAQHCLAMAAATSLKCCSPHCRASSSAGPHNCACVASASAAAWSPRSRCCSMAAAAA